MNKPSASEKVSAEINAIRTEAGWDGKTCTTCCRNVTSPYRVYDERGKVIQGCVDASHEGHTIAESSRWHHRPEALALRRENRDKLRSYVKASRGLARQGYSVDRAVVGGAQ